MSKFGQKERAFTLIEMVMVIMLMSILFISVAPLFSQGLAASRIVTEQSNSMSKLQRVVERLAREIRQVNYSSSTYSSSTWTTSQIVFNKNDSLNTLVDIRQSGSLIKLRYINSSINTDSDLSNQIKTLAFRYLTIGDVVATSTAEIAYVEMSVTLTNPSNNTDYSQRVRVALRDRV